MQIEENISLRPYNTFGIDCKASYFATVKSNNDLRAILSNPHLAALDRLVLGGGSNILLTQDFDGLVIKNDFKGIEVVEENDSEVYVRSGAGENWHEFVLHCIDNNWAGIENLSLIPGNVGASPMQNIGAYGVEVKDLFHSLTAMHVESLEERTFDNAECEFGYRESVFKRALKGQYIITSVTYKLRKEAKVNTSYGAIEQQLETMGISEPTIKDVSDAVIAIRSSKLPDPKELGNSGSFFKNPVLPNEEFHKIQESFPAIVNYPMDENNTKVAAGWLIDQAGWKGKTFGECGVHKNQALVLVNYGDATGQQIYDLSSEIVESIRDKYGIELEREVNII